MIIHNYVIQQYALLFFKKKMEQLLQQLKLEHDWMNQFLAYNQKNYLSNNPLSRLQDSNIESLQKHLKKISQDNGQKHKISWVSSQYQVLQIILNSISVLTQEIIENFTPSQWARVYAIFPYKQPLTIKYESLRIVQQKKQARRRWCASEQIFLIEIVKKSAQKNKWNDVARQLFIKSEGNFFRQGKHCRERWLNHLNPLISNNQWTKQEDIKLLSLVLKKGKKWARIAKNFDLRRSQCMVKKRFYDLVNIEEQVMLTGEALRNQIKLTLNHIKSEIQERTKQTKSKDKIQQEVDKNQPKFSTQNDKIKEQNKEILFNKEQKIQDEYCNQKPPFIQNHQGADFSYFATLENFQNYYINQPYNSSTIIPDSFKFYTGFQNILTGLINPLYPYFRQLIFPIQNNIIINQRSQKEPGFQEF